MSCMRMRSQVSKHTRGGGERQTRGWIMHALPWVEEILQDALESSSLLPGTRGRKDRLMIADRVTRPPPRVVCLLYTCLHLSTMPLSHLALLAHMMSQGEHFHRDVTSIVEVLVKSSPRLLIPGILSPHSWLLKIAVKCRVVPVDLTRVLPIVGPGHRACAKPWQLILSVYTPFQVVLL